MDSAGFEPAAISLQTKHSAKLNYEPSRVWTVVNRHPSPPSPFLEEVVIHRLLYNSVGIHTMKYFLSGVFDGS